MGKYLDKFKGGVNKVDKKLSELEDKKEKNIRNSQRETIGQDNFDEFNEFGDLDEFDMNRGQDNNFNDPFFDEVGSPKSQKSESFHHFILDNKYEDLEWTIRGYKKIWNKDNKEWITVRKKEHCFTDEEAEEILRTAQTHLATDIKLARMSYDAFSGMMNLLYDEIVRVFRRIAEYNYGRYGSYDKQGKMKSDNMKICVELYNRIWANYSRAIGAAENKATHDSVKGQESLQNTDRELIGKRRYS